MDTLSATSVAPCIMAHEDSEELRREIKKIAEENKILQARLDKSNRHLARLQLEKDILLEKFMELYPEMKSVEIPEELLMAEKAELATSHE